MLSGELYGSPCYRSRASNQSPSYPSCLYQIHTAKQEQPNIMPFVVCTKADLVRDFVPAPLAAASDPNGDQSAKTQETGPKSEDGSVGRVKFSEQVESGDEERRAGLAPDLGTAAFDYIEVAQYCKAVGASLHVTSAKTGRLSCRPFEECVKRSFFFEEKGQRTRVRRVAHREQKGLASRLPPPTFLQEMVSRTSFTAL